MNKKEHQKAVDTIKEICKDLGCTKCSLSCDTSPQNCKIIRNLMKFVMQPKAGAE
jgi:hypothetical protein